MFAKKICGQGKLFYRRKILIIRKLFLQSEENAKNEAVKTVLTIINIKTYEGA